MENDNELLRSSLETHVQLSDADFEKLLSHCTPRSYKKGQLLLAEGSVVRKTHFIKEGAVIAYYLDLKGAEHVVQFGIEGWWISDIHSYISGNPAVLNVLALEDTEVYEFTHEQMEQVYREIPAMVVYFLKITQNAFASFQNRVLSNLSSTAEDRYKAFVKRYPKLELRFPQKLIASYIGITPESLSRIKKALL